MFDHPELRANLTQLFTAQTERFDELIVAAGLNPKRDLAGADLRNADFADSIMDGWDLSGCDLTGASFSGAKIRDLITTNAIGLDLAGALSLDEVREDGRDPSGGVEWILEQIRKSTNGSQRGPLIERLLTEFGSDPRAWSFLLKHQVKRERVGKLVSKIISAWESRQQNPSVAGNELRFQLLRENGNPYITVRARILRELATRLGANDEIFEICKITIEQEGFLTSGSVALAVLARTFTGDDRVATFLEEVLARKEWYGSKGDIVLTLCKGFNSSSTRRVIELAILDESQKEYDRSSMLESYCGCNQDLPEVWQFADQIFTDNPSGVLRAAVIRARSRYGDLSDAESQEELQIIARADRDHAVRHAALVGLVRFGKEQLEFFLERATMDESGYVRSSAVRWIDAFGYSNREWFIQRFVDSDDVVRSAALSWLLSGVSTEELRGLLVNEVTRADPGFAAARAASEGLERWPNDPEFPTLVSKLLYRLPKNTSGWNSHLLTTLRKLGYNVDATN